MSLIIDLPKDLSLTLLRNWLSLRDIVRLDTSITSQELRQHWLEILANEIVSCSTVNLRDKELAKLKWLMLKNSFCNKIAFRNNCRIRDYPMPPEKFLIKWIQQSMHLKTLRFKEKTNITFHMLLFLLLVPFLQPPQQKKSPRNANELRDKENSQALVLDLEDSDVPNFLDQAGEETEEGDEDGEAKKSRKKRKFSYLRNLIANIPPLNTSSQVIGNSSSANTPSMRFSYTPILSTRHHQLRNQLLRSMQSPLYATSSSSFPPQSSAVADSRTSTEPNNSSSPQPSSAPFDVSLSPIEVLEQADSLPQPPTSSLETELLTANIAHPLTAMEVIERMIQRTLTNLKEQQKNNQQQFYNLHYCPNYPRTTANCSSSAPTAAPQSVKDSSFQEGGNDSSFVQGNANESSLNCDQGFKVDLKEENEENHDDDQQEDDNEEARRKKRYKRASKADRHIFSSKKTPLSILQPIALPDAESSPNTVKYILPTKEPINVSFDDIIHNTTNDNLTDNQTDLNTSSTRQAPNRDEEEQNEEGEESANALKTPVTVKSEIPPLAPIPPIRNQESNENSSAEENISGEDELNDIMMIEHSNKYPQTSLTTAHNTSSLTSFTYESLIKHHPELKLQNIFHNIEELYFHFHDISLLTSFFLQCLLPKTIKLKLFTIIDCMKIYDNDLNILIDSCPLLEEIMIDNCTMIQGLFFPKLIEKSVHLTKIMLKHCTIISKATVNPPSNVQELFTIPINPAEQAWSMQQAILTQRTLSSTTVMSQGTASSADLLQLQRATSTSSIASTNSNLKFHTKLACCDFTHTRDIGDYILPYLLFYCPNIERINISFCHLIPPSFQYLSLFAQRLKVLFLPGNTIDDDIIIPIVSNCPQLESMVIGFSPRVTERTINTIAKHLKQLKTFALWGNHKALNEASMTELVAGCSLLEKVALTYTGTTDAVLSILVNKCPLTRIEINGCQLLTDNCIESVADRCSQRLTHFVAENVFFTDKGCEALARCGTLEYINLSNSKFITSKGIVNLIQSCPKIEVLKIKECQLMNDEVLTAIAAHGRELRELDISYIKHFTFASILQILEKCEHLHKLYMIACFQDQLSQHMIDQSMIQEIIKIGTKKRIHIIH